MKPLPSLNVPSNVRRETINMHLSSKWWVWRRRVKQGCVGRYPNLRKVHTWTLGYLFRQRAVSMKACVGGTAWLVEFSVSALGMDWSAGFPPPCRV